MDRKIATIVGAAAALVAVPAAADAAHEAPVVQPAASYAELLEPIPDAVHQLKIADAQDARRGFENVQLTVELGNAHHHHHHHHSRDWYTRNGYMFFGGRWVTRDFYNHHHHHHHHHHSHDHY